MNLVLFDSIDKPVLYKLVRSAIIINVAVFIGELKKVDSSNKT